MEAVFGSKYPYNVLIIFANHEGLKAIRNDGVTGSSPVSGTTTSPNFMTSIGLIVRKSLSHGHATR